MWLGRAAGNTRRGGCAGMAITASTASSCGGSACPATVRRRRPRDLKHLEERLDSIQDRLGDRRRAFRNLHRLNCLLKLIAMELRGEASVTAWARLLRANHGDHAGKPPPRRQHDGEVLIP
jgi:hypothetical protein